MAEFIKIASFPMPDEDTYYFRLYYDALQKHGYKIVDTRGKTFGPAWLRENRGRVRIVHFHWPAYLYSDRNPLVFLKKLLLFILNLRRAKSMGYKIAWTVHNLFPHERNNMALEYAGRLAMSCFSDVVFVHFVEAKEMLSRYFLRKNDVYIIPHGNFSAVFENKCGREEARERLGIPPGAFVYLLFGPVRPYKGIENAIQAFKKMDDKGAVLIVAGNPKDKHLGEFLSAEAMSNTRIFPFLRFIERNEVQYFFNASDAVLLPYKQVFTSGNLFLALTFSKPVVAPDMGIISEVVDDSCGVKYSPDEANENLFNAMQMVRSVDYAKAAEAARQKALAYSWERSAEISKKAFGTF
ncbi:MAG: glycosyltransferase [Deltaproteobacteria bacterium]|nr:glycosyltransferase [Deltaproteobacteria bacterium]MBZ0219969.1 glycosyltransferase [Deltaproteobacteria bacterium]